MEKLCGASFTGLVADIGIEQLYVSAERKQQQEKNPKSGLWCLRAPHPKASGRSAVAIPLVENDGQCCRRADLL